MWGKPLRNDTIKNCWAGIRQRCVVAVHEREPVIPVAEIEILPQSLRILIDETKNTVVSTSENLHVLKIDSNPVPFVFLDVVNRHAVIASDLQGQHLFSFIEPKIDGIQHFPAFDFQEFVADSNSKLFCNAIWLNDGDFHAAISFAMTLPRHLPRSKSIISTGTIVFSCVDWASTPTRT